MNSNPFSNNTYCLPFLSYGNSNTSLNASLYSSFHCLGVLPFPCWIENAFVCTRDSQETMQHVSSVNVLISSK